MRVLVVDDDRHQAQFLQKALGQQSIAVDVAYDGETAVFLASTNDYDVILLDYVLPKSDGLSVVEKLRQKNVHTPIIFLSVHGTIDLRVKGLDLGADDFVSKPFNINELFARIRAVARRKEVKSFSQIEIGPFSIDRNRKAVSRDGIDLEISPREFRILEYLAMHKGKIVTRFDILENVWGSGDVMLSNVVDVHISHLRRSSHFLDKIRLFKRLGVKVTSLIEEKLL